jgi:hypothetical protein
LVAGWEDQGRKTNDQSRFRPSSFVFGHNRQRISADVY